MIVSSFSLIVSMATLIITPPLLGARDIMVCFIYVCKFVCTSHFWFQLNNLSSRQTNHFNFIHKVNDHKRKAKFDFRLFCSEVMLLFTLDVSGGIPCPMDIDLECTTCFRNEIKRQISETTCLMFAAPPYQHFQPKPPNPFPTCPCL